MRQCHDHPFDRWKQDDFWGYAAFFARVQQRTTNTAAMQLVDVDDGDVRIPDSDKIVPTRFPGGGDSFDAATAARGAQQLAIWMVSRDNSYLGPAAVNLVWSQLFGRGLVEPLDDFGDHNPASHPQVLNELSDWFVGTGYDVRRLHRVMANTRAYQLASTTGGEEPPPELFARMMVKTLTAEQLYDSLARVALRPGVEMQDRLADPRRQAFVIKLLTQTRTVTDFELGVPQALTLMNGQDLAELTNAAQSGLLTALSAPFSRRRGARGRGLPGHAGASAGEPGAGDVCRICGGETGGRTAAGAGRRGVGAGEQRRVHAESLMTRIESETRCHGWRGTCQCPQIR